MAAERRPARCIVDVGAIVQNWRAYVRFAPTAECAAVIKADAYGLGADAAAPALAAAGTRTFFAATLAEALAARKALGPQPTIYALNETDVTQPAFAEASIRPVINTLAQAAAWGARGPAALHIDTGMNRLGLPMSEIGEAAALLPAPAHVMSHLACVATPDHPLNARQLSRFRAASARFPQAQTSLAATGGVHLGPAYHFDMVRVGVGLYGGADSPDPPALAPACTIDAPILQVRDVASGESIGYGATFLAQGPLKTAAVALGYADGFLRSLAGRGYGVLGGERRPILGRISMDLTVLDVTGCADARVGARVQFLGPEAPLEDVAARAGTNGYELLTTFAATVRRHGAAA